MDDRKVIEVTKITGKEYSSMDRMQKEEPESEKIPKKSSASLFSKDWLKKFRTVKGIKIIIPVILLCVLLVGYVSLTSNTKAKTDSSGTTGTTRYTSAIEYTEMIEGKLATVLSKVKGAGTVNVIVSLETGPELVYATSKDTETNTVTSGNNTTTTVTVVEEPIVVTRNGESSLLILMEKMPQVKGVIVVSSGASDVRIKLELIQAIKSLLDIEDKNIQVITGI